jgi:diaminopimelate epimerase
MQVPFIKMHGLLNDFIIIDQRKSYVNLSAHQIQTLCHRRLGVGCDQLIFITEPSSKEACAKMRIWNADGSEVNMCGNALRCVASLLFKDHNQHSLTLETNAGLYVCTQKGSDIAVHMGKPSLNSEDIPTQTFVDLLNLKEIQIKNLPAPSAASLGNPHLVFFVPNIQSVNLNEIGPQLETNPLFLKRINVSIAEIMNINTLKLKTWERGAGLTPACGSAACCSAFLGFKKNLLSSSIEVLMEGGQLHIEVQKEENLIMTGPAQLAFQGYFNLST